MKPAETASQAVLERLRDPRPLVAVELRPPRAGLSGREGMDTWIGGRLKLSTRAGIMRRRDSTSASVDSSSWIRASSAGAPGGCTATAPAPAETVKPAVAESAAAADRPASSVRLVGVSKGYPASAVEEAVAAGLVDIGENRVQEAGPKIAAVSDKLDALPRWHLIGHLQRNKVGAAVRLFDTIQSIDSVRIAEAVSRSAGEPVPVFLEVQYQRTGERYGFDPELIGDELRRIEELPKSAVA